MRRRRSPARDLRLAVECLPEHTRIAMLEGIREEEIIVGAYTDRHGGTCPMLAAHRRGGRTAFAGFARAWDRYARAGRGPRRATRRELRALEAMLEASLAGGASLAEAVDEVKSARRAEFEREAAASSPTWANSPSFTFDRPAARTESPARDTPAMSSAGT